jgi:hypothetical protein
VFKCSLRFFVVQTGLRLGEDYSLYDSISLMSESVRLFLKRNELKVGPYLSCVTTDVTLFGNSACRIYGDFFSQSRPYSYSLPQM